MEDDGTTEFPSEFDFEQLGYLERLTVELTIGAAQLEDDLVERHLGYLLSKQNADGGWAGREGPSDLYYTSFALRSLAILGQLNEEIAFRVSSFLKSKLGSRQTYVDLLSLIYSQQLLLAASGVDAFADVTTDWAKAISDLLNALRRSDGGFAKSEEGRVGSTYQTFLILIGMELMNQAVEDADSIANFLLNQQQEDGGFLEIRVAKRSGANPTAAAIGGLRTLKVLSPDVANDAGEFLLTLQSDSGGFEANTRMPVPDVLSTFTSLVTLWDTGMILEADLDAAKSYVSSMQRAEGGFAGFELDPEQDVEYTFYGLGGLALIAAEKNS